MARIDNCYDCGSPYPHRHTPLCDLAQPDDLRDLPVKPGTQYFDPTAVKLISQLSNESANTLRKGRAKMTVRILTPGQVVRVLFGPRKGKRGRIRRWVTTIDSCGVKYHAEVAFNSGLGKRFYPAEYLQWAGGPDA